MQPLKKHEDHSSVNYSFLFTKLEQLSRENALYRKAFRQIEDVAKNIGKGNLSARISQPDKFCKLTPMLVSINQAFDFTANYIRESEASQQTALEKQDEHRIKQLNELACYFKQQIAPALK